MLRVLREWVLARSAPASPLARACALHLLCRDAGVLHDAGIVCWLGLPACAYLMLVIVCASCEWCGWIALPSELIQRCPASFFAGSRPLPTHPLPCLFLQMMKKMMLIAPVCFSSAYANGSIDEAIKTMKEQMKEQKEQMKEQMMKQERLEAHFQVEMIKKDETIAALTAALKAKTEHRQVQLTAGGEVMQLVSEADFKELTARVVACEKTNTDQDAKLDMTMDTLSKVRKEIKDGRVGAPPALPPSLPPPLPPPRPVATGRRLQSSSNGNFVNELSITGPNAVVSWNSHTPGLTSFNCTGVGDGGLTCSGELRAENFVTGRTSLEVVASEVDAIRQFVGMMPPLSPPSPSPPPPVALPRVAARYNCCPNGVTSTNPYYTAPSNAIDGDVSTTAEGFYDESLYSSGTPGMSNPWLEVDLGTPYQIGSVQLYNRDGSCGQRLGSYDIYLSNSQNTLSHLCGSNSVISGVVPPYRCGYDAVPGPFTTTCDVALAGQAFRYVYLLLPGNNRILHINELYLFGP